MKRELSQASRIYVLINKSYNTVEAFYDLEGAELQGALLTSLGVKYEIREVPLYRVIKH